jgi:HK97 family phage major capsid protein
MDLTQLIEQRKAKLSELEGVLGKAKLENREMFTSENDCFNSINAEIQNIDNQIEEKRKITAKNNIKIVNKKNTMEQENRFSLIKSIRDYVEGRGTSDSTLEVMEAGKKEMTEAGLSYRGQIVLPYEYRTIVNATTNTEGEYAIAEQKFDLIGALRGNLVAVKAGATLLTGLKGTVSIPKYAGSTSAWKGENVTATSGIGAFSEVTMSAKRITSILDISKLFLNQDSTGAEQLLMQDLNASVLSVLESTIFGVASGNTTQPEGMLYNASYTSTGTTTFAKVVALESAVDTSNALTGNIAYITTPALRGVGKTTAKAANGGTFVVEGNTANGYPIYSTSHMNAGKVVFGNFGDLIIGNWGAIDITVDPFTQAHLGVVRLVVNSYWDFAKRRTESFAYGNLT